MTFQGWICPGQTAARADRTVLAILVFNTVSFAVQGRWSPLATWPKGVKTSVKAGRPIPASEPPID